MSRRHNVFYDEHADHVAWKAYDLWMHDETAQDVARALGIEVPQVPRPFRERWERFNERDE